MTNKPLHATIVFFALISSTFGQQSGAEPESVILSEVIMEQVVSRIIRWQFRPAKKPRRIPVADTGLKREWLPDIKNIKFELVPESRVSEFEKGVFQFEPVTRSREVFSINVGWGDLDCRAIGDTWRFTVRGDRVRLWPTGEGWGRGCVGNSPPVVRGLKLGDVSPNELTGFEFFAKGKLRHIRLGISTRDDMKNLFGATCEGVCDYDANWSIFVNYFDLSAGGSQTTYIGDQKIETMLTPKPERLGTLRFVTMLPKKRISFVDVFFPRRFTKNQSYAIGDDWDENGFAGAVHSTRDTYTDGYGLQYVVIGAETFNNLREKRKSDDQPLRKGHLVKIEYEIPSSLEDAVYDKRAKDPAAK